VVTVGVGTAVVVRVALGVFGVLGALGVGFVGVSGSAVTVGMGPVESPPTAPVAGVVAVGCVVGDSIAVVCCAALLQADNVTPRTTAIAAEANPPRRLPVLRTPALTCI
jgi:hypothetical protein